MAFRKPKQQPEFADLKGILAQSKETDNPTYQTLQILIERLTQLQLIVNDDVSAKLSDDAASKKFAPKSSSFITKDDETSALPNSQQLIAGTGMTFDTTVPNQLKLNAAGGSNHYDTPLTDGDPLATDLIFAAGECIIVQVPV